MSYIAKVGLSNDKTGKRFEPGDKVTDEDFSRAVIENWLEIGALIPDSSKPEPKKKKAVRDG